MSTPRGNGRIGARAYRVGAEIIKTMEGYGHAAKMAALAQGESTPGGSGSEYAIGLQIALNVLCGEFAQDIRQARKEQRI